MKSDSRERRNGLRMSHPEVSREATMGPDLIRGGVAESQVGVDLDSGVFCARQHGGNLRLPLCRSVDTLRTLLCDDLHPTRPPKAAEVLKDREPLDGERGGPGSEPGGP